MKRKKNMVYIVVFFVVMIILGGNIMIQAKKKELSLNQKNLTLQVGQKKKLKVNGTFKKVVWTSSNKKVAAVSKKGIVKAKKKGKAMITARVGTWEQKAEVLVQNSTQDSKDAKESNINTPAQENHLNNGKIPKELEEIPAAYFKEANQKGTLVELDYETYESKTYQQKSKKLKKRAIIYLPYGYSEKEKYNVFYLMHGGWSNETSSLGTPKNPNTFKNVIDHAIEDGKMKPFLIVCPTYNNESSSDSGDYTLAFYTLTVNYHNELTNDLIPAVEGTYSTYAENVTKEGIKNSRDHRAFGGFSMGSVTTWHTFMNCLDEFRYFLPMSGAVDSNGDAADRAVTASGHQWNDFFLYTITGTEDFASSQFESQINGMLHKESKNFREADNEEEGNLAFRIKEGYSHDGKASMEYIYNGMLWFWNHGNGNKKETEKQETVEKVTEKTLVKQVMNNPVFGSYGRLLFPVDEVISDTLALEDMEEILPWYHNVKPEKTVEIVNTLMERAAKKETVFYDIYTEEEKQKDKEKENTGLFFFKGTPGEKFAVLNAGGGFVYVGAMHDSFPAALELSKKGYNAFALVYRPGQETACEDLARAISFIYEHKEELEVDVNGYSLWGGSAGARMAALVGNKGYFQKLTGRSDLPLAAVVIMQYTGYSSVSPDDPPTYACVGTNDGIASYKTMQNRIQRIKEQGTDAEIEIFDGLPHGFGLGTGTAAEGWIDHAISFWERHMGK